MKYPFYTFFSSKTFHLNIPKFIKTGMFVICAILLTAVTIDRITGGAINALLGNSINTSSFSLIQEKKLPIYCVKTDEKKISLTFDGAWDDGK